MSYDPKNLVQGGASGSTLGTLFKERRDFYIAPNVVSELWQDVTPFTTLLSRLGSVAINDPVFKQFEYRNAWLDQTITLHASAVDDASHANIPDHGASITVNCSAVSNGVGGQYGGIKVIGTVAPLFDDSAIGLVLQLKVAEVLVNFLVTAVPSTTSLTLKRVGHVGTVVALNGLQTSAVLSVIGTNFDEGTFSPKASSDDISVVFGRTQIMKTAVEVTGTLYHTSLRGYSNELERLRVEKLKEHKIQKERTFLLGIDNGGTGQGSGETLEDSKSRFTMGLIPAIIKYGAEWDKSNPMSKKYSRFNFTGGTTGTSYSEFVAMMENMFAFIPSSSSSRMLMCGSGVLNYFNQVDNNSVFFGKAYGNGGINLGESVKSEYGFNVRKLETPFGDINLVLAPVLRGDWRNYGVIIDTENVKNYVFRPTVYQTDIKKDDGYDGVKDQIMSDEGVGLTMIEKHSLIKVTPAAL